MNVIVSHIFGSKIEGRTLVIIDGNNLHWSCKKAGFIPEFKKLRLALLEQFDVKRISYFSTIEDSDDENSLVKLYDWLAYNGYDVNLRFVKGKTDNEGRIRIPNNVDVEICISVMRAISLGNIDNLIMFSGSQQLTMLVEEAKRMNVRTFIISGLDNSVSDELRRSADVYVDIRDIEPIIRSTKDIN
jgi:uncharacterized LabA/DUF88 family protein